MYVENDEKLILEKWFRNNLSRANRIGSYWPNLEIWMQKHLILRQKYIEDLEWIWLLICSWIMIWCKFKSYNNLFEKNDTFISIHIHINYTNKRLKSNKSWWVFLENRIHRHQKSHNFNLICQDFLSENAMHWIKKSRSLIDDNMPHNFSLLFTSIYTLNFLFIKCLSNYL